MAIALVKAGTLASGTATSISPTFGQATTAGNLLIACLGNTTTGDSWSTTASGWTRAHRDLNGASEIWYKANCGASETAPTFTGATSGFTNYAVLSEWSGAAQSSPLDQTGDNPTSPACTAADVTPSDLAVVSLLFTNTKSATYTFSDSWTPTGGSSGVIASAGSTKAVTTFYAPYYLLSGHGGGGVADKDVITITPSTGVQTTPTEASIASFKPPVTHRNAAINFQDPALLMRGFRQRIRQHGRIFVPGLWLPEPATI